MNIYKSTDSTCSPHRLYISTLFNETKHELISTSIIILDFPHSSVGKKSTCNAGDLGSIPGLGKSPGEGNSNHPLQYSCLENPPGRGAWQATVHGVTRFRHDLALNHYHHKLTQMQWLKQHTFIIYCSGDQKSDMGLTKLRSIWQPGWIPLGGSWERILPFPFSVLRDCLHPWVTVTSSIFQDTSMGLVLIW